MAQSMVIQGRIITADEIGLIRGLMVEHRDWGRTRLSEELCRRWDWRNAQGRIKDMAARTLLLKLERRGFIELPARQRPSSNEFRNCRVPVVDHVGEPIRGDWQGKYGHPVHALETFVDRGRFRGTCYRAANWLRLGATRGRTRNDRHRRIQASIKDVYLYPLIPEFRRELCASACSRTEGGQAGDDTLRG